MENVKLEEILEGKKPQYEPPKVITLSKDEILEELGPARACYTLSSGPCPALGG
jgi:hypothetical protein